MSIIDTPFNTESRIPCLLSQGVRTVIRYYNFSNSRSFPEKRMELAEVQALAANRMQIAVVFQQRQNKITDFTEAKGVAAMSRLSRASALFRCSPLNVFHRTIALHDRAR